MTELYNDGQAIIYQGDGIEVLASMEAESVDCVVTSPPYEAVVSSPSHGIDMEKRGRGDGGVFFNSPYSYTRPVDAIVTSPPYEASEVSPGNVGNRIRKETWGRGHSLSPENGYTRPVDAIVTSPPYANRLADTYVDDDPQRMSYEMGKAKIDAIVSSPPYEEAQSGGGIAKKGHFNDHGLARRVYSADAMRSDVHHNIGNLRGDAYWEAMSATYAECLRVLRPGGLMALVLKGFTRDGKYVDLPGQTQELCESLGFKHFDTWRRELWSLSFWRILQGTDKEETVIAHRRDMFDLDVQEIKRMKRVSNGKLDERLRFEEVLAFRKG